MTACVDNNQKKGGAAKAVSATLAGVLAVGMVPAVAFATEGEAPAEEGDVSLLVADDAFKNAELVSYTDLAGNTTEAEEGEDIEIAFTGTPNYITSVVLKLADGNDTEVTVTDGGNYEFTYWKGGAEVSKNDIQETDTYKLKIEYVGEDLYKGQTFERNFTIVAEATDPAVSFEMITSVVNGEVTATDPTIIFNDRTRGGADGIFNKNAVGTIAVLVNGEATTITDAKVYKASDTSTALGAEAYLYAGDYVAVVSYVAGGETESATVPFTISPFDLGSATVVADATDNVTDLTGQKPGFDYTIAGVADTLKDAVALSYDYTKNNNVLQSLIEKPGAYTFTLSADQPNNSERKAGLAASITGTKDFTVDFVKTVVDITYNSNPLEGEIGSFTIDGGTMFSAKDVKFSDGVDSDLCSVTVKNAAGETVTDWATTPGKYTVVAEVNDPKFEFGGAATATFVVKYADAQTDGIYVQYDGQLVSKSKIETTYDGTNVIDGITVKVVNGESTMVEGTDYKLVYTNTKTKKEVTEIVDAGTYQLEVKPITFAFSGDDADATTVAINVAKVVPTGLRVANQIEVTVDGATQKGLGYTGEAITPAIEYTLADDPTADDAEWAVLPADVYTLDYEYSKDNKEASKPVDEVLKAGYYTANLTLNVNAKNYGLDAVESAFFWVIDGGRFLDVPASEWYAPYIDKVATATYLVGYNGGSFFGPNDSIKRGDVAMVLARMADVALEADENSGSEIGYYVTPFSDVDGNLYYAQAIAWAAKSGIITGDEGQGTFRPEDTVTRQEFAAMLARFAEKAGDDMTVDAAAELAKYDDAASIPAWAEDAIAWLSSEGIMTGIGGTSAMQPQGTVTRGMVAKMVAEYMEL